MARTPPLRTLPGYGTADGRDKDRGLLIAAIAAAAGIYGALVAALIPAFLLPLTIPLVLLALAVIWVLPESRVETARALEGILLIFFAALFLWPDYLALDLLNLPWITLRRLIAVPMVLVLLIALSISPAVRRQLKATFAASPVIFWFFLAFVAIQFFSVFLSASPDVSVDKLIVAQLYWTVPFLIGCYVFRKTGAAERWVALFCLMLIPLTVIGLWEWTRSQVPWAGSIPGFLKIEDEAVQRILAGASRAATGIYRVQSTFTTSLGFAEYLALTTPFLIHYSVSRFRWPVRIACAAALPVIFFMITLTDSRLGAVGFLLSLILYLAGWAALRWRWHRESLFGPAITVAFPIIFAAFIAATFLVGRLRRLVWGGGEHQFSNDARGVQYSDGLEILAANPIGHGIGMGAETLAFRNLAGVLTIDTYYLLIALEYGVLGFLAYYGFLLLGTAKAGMILLKERAPDRETLLLLPLAIALTSFLVIKSVFSQEANHPLVFMMLAMVFALVARVQNRAVDAPLSPARSSPARRGG